MGGLQACNPFLSQRTLRPLVAEVKSGAASKTSVKPANAEKPSDSHCCTRDGRDLPWLLFVVAREKVLLVVEHGAGGGFLRRAFGGLLGALGFWGRWVGRVVGAAGGGAA